MRKCIMEKKNECLLSVCEYKKYSELLIKKYYGWRFLSKHFTKKIRLYKKNRHIILKFLLSMYFVNSTNHTCTF